MKLLAAFPLLFSLHAQTTSTGALECHITDSTGAPIPQTRITLIYRASNVSRLLITNDLGAARATGLTGGEYSLHIEHPGFNPVAVESLSVSLGQTTVQRITLTPATVTEKMEVRESPDALQTTATTSNVSLTNERIEEAPAPNRNYLAFVLSTPGVASSAGSNTNRSFAALRNPANDSGFVFAGMRGRNNSISIDGVDNRDETTGGSRVAIGLEMVHEFRVSGTSVGVEFGGAAGGLVNMVTHSGENLWHGDFTFFHQNESLNARNAEAETSARPRFRRYQPGFSVGGPIRRDRTFFFTAFETSHESGQEWSESPRSLTPRLYRGLFDTGESDTVWSFKLNHQLTTNNSLLARYAFSRGRVRNDVQSVDNFTDISARGSSLVTDHSFVGGWSAVIGTSLLSDLRLQLSQRSADVTPTGSGPMIEIPGVITFGAVYSLDQARTERHAEIIESLSWSKGRHLVTAGASLHRISWDGRLANRFHGLYVFPTLSAFNAAAPDVYIQAFGDPHTQINTTPAGFWLQDHWQLTPALSLEAGLRYDRQWLPHPFPSPNGNIAPRLGIAWHPTASSSWVFRAGAGLFYDRYPLEYLNLAIQKDGQHGFEQYFVGNLAAQIYQSTSAGALSQPRPSFPISTYSPAPGFTSTYSRKLTAGLERRLDRDTTFTAEFSDVNGLHLPRLRNANLTLPPQYHLEQTAFSTYRGLSLSVNRRLRNEFTYLASYSIGTTQDDSSDYDEQPLNPANTRQDFALSRQHQRHRLSLSGVYELPVDGWSSGPHWLRNALDDFTVAPVFCLGSGRPLNTLLTTDVYRTGAYPITARPLGFPRNISLTPRTVSFDARLMKTILVKEGRARLQFGAEGFNILNHTNRLRISPYYTSTFRGIIETQTARQVQLMIQFEY